VTTCHLGRCRMEPAENRNRKRQRAAALHDASRCTSAFEGAPAFGLPQPPAAEKQALSTIPLPPAKPLQQFRVNAAESTVAEHAHDVASFGAFSHVINDGFNIRQIGGGFAVFADLLHQ